jgi:hypothetical protein
MSRLLPILALVALLVAAGPAAAGGDKPDIVDPKGKTYGKTYEGWAGAWWQWVLEHPATNNPILDDTGADCDEDQRGKVWFLAGNFGGETHRTCTVPNGKALFFPVFNGWADNINPFGPATTLTKGELADLCESVGTNPSSMSVEIDGKSVKKLGRYTIDPTLFFYTTPEDDSMIDFLAPGNTFAGDVPAPGAVACGTYLLLEPLSKGHHDLRIQAVSADGTFSLDVTYDLTIKK